MKKFALKFLILAFSTSLLSQASLAASIDGMNSCQNYSYTKSSDTDRQELLSALKVDVMADLKMANINLEEFYNNLRTCNDIACIEFSRNFHARLREQVKLAKYAQAISTRGLGIFSYLRSPRTAREFIRRKNFGDKYHGALVLNHILNFDLPGFTFSEKEKKEVFDLWWKTFISIAHERGAKENIRNVFKETQDFFGATVDELVHLNPMLGYVTEEDLKDPNEISRVLGKIVRFNKEFIGIVDGYKTVHETGLGSNLKIWTQDHEMRLVNFRMQADDLLAAAVTPEDTNIMCSAWADLKTQQKWRINTSIGVGFGTAIVCGVGSLAVAASGPLGWAAGGAIAGSAAVALCAPAFADSMLGAYRGYYDARTGFLSQYAGRQIDFSGNFTDSILALQDGSVMQNKSTGVFLVNALALIPAFKVVAHARHIEKMAATGKAFNKPRIRDYLIMPLSDSTVSATEKASYHVAYLLIATKGFEFFQKEFPLMVKSIIESSDWP